MVSFNATISRLDVQAASASDEPIAVIGLACRLPKAANPAEFWTLLRDGVDAVGEVPDDRRHAAPAEHRVGGFLDDVAAFDADFFGISPKEAAAMDPQQRLVLELAWEALESARLVPAELRASPTGVFIGAIADDYAMLTSARGDAAVGHHAMTGLNRGMIANRVSYTLGLRGPSVTVDAAQSASLVAVHMAAESLRRGEITMAVAGGVQLNLAAQSTVRAARFGGLSPDSRCFTFDAKANGFVRGEGGGLVVLKPLSAALADADPITCVILGSATNHDGVSEGLTVPNQRAQEDLLRLAYQRAGVAPSEVQYVELHGSGTAVGDPIEAASVGAVLGTGRPTGEPLAVGSVKTNVGHLEGAGGIAGLVKAALSIERRQLPPSLNFDTPNPRIPFDDLRIRVQGQLGPWSRADRPLLAGVSSFGVGGTNCHVVLCEPPRPVPRPDAGLEPVPDGIAVPWVLSGRGRAGLAGQARRLADFAADGAAEIGDVGLSLAVSRSAFADRAVVFGRDAAELVDGLRSLASGAESRGVLSGRAVAVAGPVFVFPGQGWQWHGMGAELLEQSAVFRESVELCEEALAPFVDWSLRAVLRGESGAPGLDRVDVVQPVSWAVMVSLAALWRSMGVTPSAVVGHSQGEIAAAVVAGGLSIVDGARIVALRSKLIGQHLAGRGGMLSIGLGVADAESLVSASADVSVAAVNGTSATVLSGEVSTLEELRARLERTGVPARMLPVDYASHSARVAVLRAELLECLRDVAPRAGSVPFVSSVTGTTVDLAELDAGYWYRNLRQPVRFDRAVRSLSAAESRLFVEVSGHPVLLAGIDEILAQDDITGGTVGSLRRDDGGLERFWRSAGEAWVHGAPVRFAGCYPDGTLADLPTYAFRRRRHWLEPTGGTDPVPDRPVPSTEESFAEPGDRVPASIGLVQASAAAVLGHDSPDRVDPNRTFKDLGFDSLTVLELRNRLSRVTGLPLPAGVLFDHPTPSALARHLAGATTPGRDLPSTAPDDDLIAITGMGCRYPGGVGSAEDLWRIVADGTDVTTEFPDNRGWDLAALAEYDRPGGSQTQRGGFLLDADQFDPAFFDIGPREATAMDPQQRILLEVSWEALERAGIDPAAVRESSVGVFVGAMSQDYGPRLHRPAEGYDGYLLTGTTASVASGRIAYHFGFTGPAVTVDTACSSSLVALHLAVRALRAGECDLALAGGVAVMASPGLFVEFSRQRGLAPDGRCKSFAAAADGTAWSEGAGMLVVERLSDARRRGHRVLAVIRGSAINQDGASNGLTAPSGLAQQRVIRQALVSANLSPADVDAVEAHGTGTTLGDPIEAEALIATYGADRPVDRPLWLGSLKSNLGHTQAAAGVGGVIKMIMASRHGELPRTLHVDEPSPHVDWSGGSVRLLTEAQPWPETGRARRAAVSSFGISGTNAHVIIEAAPAATDAPGAGRVQPLVLSAKTESAVREQARRLRSFLAERPDVELGDIAYSLTTRSTLDYRAAVLGESREDLLAGLAALASGDTAQQVVRGASNPNGRTAFVFPGEDAYRAGAGWELYTEFPEFTRALNEVAERFGAELDRPLLEVLFADAGTPEAESLREPRCRQPAVFAVEVALFRQLRAWGMTPDVVLGHAVGEVAAAHVAGVLSLADACRLVAARGALATARTGDETTALAEFRRVAEQLTYHPPTIPIAATGDIAEPEYWVSQARCEVQLRQRIQEMLADRVECVVDCFVELGPAGALAEFAQDRLPDDVVALSVFSDQQPEARSLVAAAVRAHLNRPVLDWPAVLAGGRVVELPTYPFERRRYWLASGDAVAGTGSGHPFLDTAVALADGTGTVFNGRLSPHTQTWLADHAVAGAVVLPGTAMVELATQAGARVGDVRLADLILETPLFLDTTGAVLVQVLVAAQDETGRRSVSVYSRPDKREADWTRHAVGVLERVEGSSGRADTGWALRWPPEGERIDIADAYDRLAERGYRYGPAFRGLVDSWHAGADRFVEVELTASESSAARSFGVHPALLDAALHVLVLDRDDAQGQLAVPFAWRGVRVYQSGATRLRVRLRPVGPDTTSLVATDPTGRLVISVDSLSLRPVTGDWSAPGPAPAVTSAQPAESWLARLTELTVAEQRAALLELVRAETAAVLEATDPGTVDPGRSLRDQGVDSLAAMELTDRLAEATELKLPVSLVIDQPSAAEIADFLRQEIMPAPPSMADRVREQLTRLDGVLADGAGDDDARAMAVSYLRTFLADLTGADGHDPLGSASDEDLFALIDNEL